MKQFIDKDWDSILHNEFEKPYFKELLVFLNTERKHHQIFPPESKLFEALK
jgi:uracil-DNA glycosylase